MSAGNLAARGTRSRLVARMLFGGSYPDLDLGEHYFDATTVALRPILRARIRPGARVLDLGAGSAAVIGLWLWRRLGCSVTCTEIDPRLAERAREAVQLNGAPIEVLCTSHFEGLRGDFDCVVFNPPYVPTAAGLARGLPERFRSQWDGGPDGTSAIAAFLEDFEGYEGARTAFLGVNSRHVPRERMRELLAKRAGLEVEEHWRHPFLPVDVYVLDRRKSPIASASSPVE